MAAGTGAPCQTLLDDESAGASIQTQPSGAAPFTGSFRPNAPLSALDGQNPNGTWQLEAQDFFTGDTGNIRAFSLIITPAVCDAPPLTSNVSGTKTVSGTFNVGGTVTYTVTLTNQGGFGQGDNPGNEFTDVLPASLTLVSASATSGTAVATVGTNTVTWNGSIPGLGGVVTLAITATINGGTGGTTIANQGTVNYDADANGTNESTSTTDDPSVGGANDPTTFVVAGGLFYVVAPCRAVDTRIRAPDRRERDADGRARRLRRPRRRRRRRGQRDGHRSDGGWIPNLFAGNGSANGTSMLNFKPGVTRAGNVISRLATDSSGTVKVDNGSSGTVHLTLDVSGYFR